MLPANRNDNTVRVHRSLDVDEDDLLDAVTAFALAQDLEIDHRHDGDGLVFRRKKQSTPNVDHLFKRADALQVFITADERGHDVEFVADLRGAKQKSSENRRGHVVRSGLIAAGFGYLGVRGLIVEVSFFDFVWLALSARFGLRARRFASSDPDLDQVERDVANALNRVCDDAQFGLQDDAD